MDDDEEIVKVGAKSMENDYKPRLYLPPVIDNIWKCRKCVDTCISYDHKPLKPFGCCLNHLGQSLTCTEESEYEQCGFYGLAYDNEINKECRNIDTTVNKEYSYSADGKTVFSPGVRVKFENIENTPNSQYILLMVTDDGIDYSIAGFEVLPRGNWETKNMEKYGVIEPSVYTKNNRGNPKIIKSEDDDDLLVDDTLDGLLVDDLLVDDALAEDILGGGEGEEVVLVDDVLAEELEAVEEALGEEEVEDVNVEEAPDVQVEDIVEEENEVEDEVVVDAEEEIALEPGARRLRRKLPVIDKKKQAKKKKQMQKKANTAPLELPPLVCNQKKDYVVISNGCYKAFNGAPKSLALLPCIANDRYNPLPKTSSKYKMTRGKSYKYNDLGTICNMTTYKESVVYINKKKNGLLTQEDISKENDPLFDYYGMYITTDDAAIEYLELNSMDFRNKFIEKTKDTPLPQLQTKVTNFDTNSVFLYDKNFQPKGSSNLSDANRGGVDTSVLLYVLGGIIGVAFVFFTLKFFKDQNNNQHQYSSKKRAPETHNMEKE